MANYLDETGLARVWGKVKGLFTKSNVETALGHTIDKNVPSNAVFTDSNVTQTATDGSSNAEYEILFSGTADNTTRTEGTKKTSRFTFNPQTNQVTAGHFTAESTSPSGTSTATLQGNDVKLGGTSNTWDGTNTSLKTTISGIKQSLSNLIQYVLIQGTTSSSGALALPSEVVNGAILDMYYEGAGVNGFINRRDKNYLTCYDNNLNIKSSTAVKIHCYYTPISQS